MVQLFIFGAMSIIKCIASKYNGTPIWHQNMNRTLSTALSILKLYHELVESPWLAWMVGRKENTRGACLEHVSH